jgi:hypothetical protein
MNKNTLLSLSLLAIVCFNSAPLAATSPIETEEGQLVIHNRILVKVNKKTISVLDVLKKMDIFLNTYYPQYTNSPATKHQYFSSQWKETLLRMVDQELILADAEKMDLKLTDAEVRETLLEKFGPNVMATLNDLNLTYEEAKQLVHSELVEQRMMWFKVHSKALAKVNTKDVKAAYTTYCKNNPSKENWKYEVLSIKAETEELAQQIAEKAYALCESTSGSIAKVAEELAPPESEEGKPPFTISVSAPFETEDKNLSKAHKLALSDMVLGAISAPAKQVSRSGQGSVFRIFHLIDHSKTAIPTLTAMNAELHDKLVQEAVDKEAKLYISKLRERFGFNAKTLEETIPAGFQPFSLQ